MKQLSEFEGVKGLIVAADVLEVILEILGNDKNKAVEGASPYKMFCSFMKNSPEEMMKIFSILSETPEGTEYTCNGAEAMENMLKLSNDDVLLSLFISQGQTGDAKSSGSASETSEE